MLSARAAHHIDWMPTEIHGHQIQTFVWQGMLVGRSVDGWAGCFRVVQGVDLILFHAVPSARIYTAHRARDVRADGVYTTRGIFRLDGSATPWKRAGFLKTTVDRRTRGMYARQRLFTSRRMLLPVCISRPAWRLLLASPRHPAKRKARKLEPWMAWRIAGASVSDTSDFSIKFSRRGNLSPVTPPGKTRSSHSHEAIPITIAPRFSEMRIERHDNVRLISFWVNKWSESVPMYLYGNSLEGKNQKDVQGKDLRNDSV